MLAAAEEFDLAAWILRTPIHGRGAVRPRGTPRHELERAMASERDNWGAAAKLRLALEARGVAPELIARLTEVLLPRFEGRGREEAQDLIEAVAASYRIYAGEAVKGPAAERQEFENLFSDIANEIRKLDEGVRLLAGYAIQLRQRVEASGNKVLH